MLNVIKATTTKIKTILLENNKAYVIKLTVCNLTG